MELGAHQGRGDRIDTAAESLARDDHVGIDPFVLVGPEPTGAAKAGLDLVDDQEHAPLSAQPREPREVVLGRQEHPEGRWDRLQDHRCGVVVEHALHRLEIAEGDLLEAGEVGTEGRSILGVTGREGEARVPMVSAGRGDDGVAWRGGRSWHERA